MRIVALFFLTCWKKLLIIALTERSGWQEMQPEMLEELRGICLWRFY